MCYVKGCVWTEPRSGYLLPPLMLGCYVLTKISKKPLLVLTDLHRLWLAGLLICFRKIK